MFQKPSRFGRPAFDLRKLAFCLSWGLHLLRGVSLAVTVDQFGKALVASGLMTAEEVKALWATIPSGERPKDGDGFAQVLVKQEKLNSFQAQELLSGSGTPLVLNQYVLLSKIGAGGMGQVFKAQHRKMKRLAAIKLLPAALTKDEAAVKRFQREVEAAAKLSHPNIVQTHDADECRGIHYMVMECVDGQDLSALVKQNGPLPVDNAVDYILQAARGLAFAHAEGVVHRDIKPANLLLDKKGVVKILDMGLARIDDGNTADHQLTNTGTVMGTVDYMPPEQANDTRKADARSDVYSLGCSLYRILTGESVFGGETVVQKIMAHMGDPIPSLLTKRPDCPAEIDRIFQKMLAKRPDDRYQQAAQVVAELEAWRNPGATTSFSGSTAASQDANLNDFFRSVGGAKPASSQSSASVKTATKHTVIGAPEQTAAYSGAELHTDPKSQVGPSLVTSVQPSPAATKPKAGGNRGKKPPVKLIAAGAAGFLFLLLGVILVIRNDKGETVAEVKVPAGNTVEVKPPVGGSVQVKPDGATAAALPALPKTTVPMPQSVPTTPAIVATALPSTSSLAPNPAAVVYLDDLQEKSYDGLNRLYKPGRNAADADSLQGAFPGDSPIHSMMMHPPQQNDPPEQPARLVYDLAGKYSAFQAVFRARRARTSLLFAEVWGDGKRLWESGDFGSRQTAGATADVDVRGVRELTLVVRAEKSNATAHALLIEPRLTPLSPGGSSGGGPTVAARWPYDPPDGREYAWSAPENLGPGVNGSGRDMNPRLTDDERTLIFNRGYELFTASRRNREESFDPCEPLTGKIQDLRAEASSITGDGLEIYLYNTGGPRQVWLAKRPAIDQPFGEPVLLGPPVSVNRNDQLPVVSSDGRQLAMFSSRNADRPGDTTALYFFQRGSRSEPFREAVHLDRDAGLERGRVTPSWLSADGRVLLTTVQLGNIWPHYWHSRGSSAERFSPGVPFGEPFVGPISPGGGWVSPDGQRLYFHSREVPGGLGELDLWMVRRVPKAAASASAPPSPAAAVVYLDDLAEKSYVGLDRLHKPGRNTDDAALFAKTFPSTSPVHTLMMHPLPATQSPDLTSRAVYELPAAFSRFQGRVRVRSISRSQPIFAEVWGDGKLLWKSEDLVPRKVGGVSVDIGVHGVRELALVARAEKDVDSANTLWIEPRLTPIPSGGAPSVTAPAPANATQVDLLSLVDLDQDVLEGQWTRQGPELHSAATASENHLLRLPVDPGEEYSLQLAFAADRGYPKVTLPFEPKGLVVFFGGRSVSLQLKGPKGDQENPQGDAKSAFGEGRRRDVRIDVTRPTAVDLRIVVGVSGETVLDWTGSREQLQANVGPDMSEPTLLFESFQTKAASTRLIEAKLTTIRGTIRPLRSISPTAPPPAKAPFDATQARAHQAAWAKHLGTQVETVNSVGQKMVLIPPGEFLMGSTDEQVEAALKAADEIKADQPTKDRIQKNERPQHNVVITKPFLMSATEVTIGQFKKFAAAMSYQTEAEKAEIAAKSAPGQPPPKPIPTYLKPGYVVADDSPAAAITWDDAVAYCKWLSDQEKTTYRLPTEAEWEYACRAGTTTQYSFGDDYNELPKYGWDNKNAGGKSHPVGTLLPNGFGLFDMHGNLYERCGDYYDEKWHSVSALNDPNGPIAGSTRVIRGGNWSYNASLCRSAARYFNAPSLRYNHSGFRCVRVLDDSSATASVTTQPAVPVAASGKLFMHDPAFPQWMKDVQAMPAERQIEAVSKKLVELNPGFDGTLLGAYSRGKPVITDGTVREVEIRSDAVTDLSPVRVFSSLKVFGCLGIDPGMNQLTDLAPLQGVRLTKVTITKTRVSDLTPLQGMPLVYLYAGSTQVSSLMPLQGMPLKVVFCGDSPVSDILPLLPCKNLEQIQVRNTQVTPAAIAALQKALPNCKIEWDDPAKVTPTPAASGTK